MVSISTPGLIYFIVHLNFKKKLFKISNKKWEMLMMLLFFIQCKIKLNKILGSHLLFLTEIGFSSIML